MCPECNLKMNKLWMCLKLYSRLLLEKNWVFKMSLAKTCWLFLCLFFSFFVLGSSEVQWEECKKELAGKLVESCNLRNILKVICYIFATFWWNSIRLEICCTAKTGAEPHAVFKMKLVKRTTLDLSMTICSGNQ